MFSGLIQSTGRVFSFKRNHLGVQMRSKRDRKGDSIAINGVCLTVTKKKNGVIFFDLSPETLQKTTLKGFEKGRSVNIERALKASESLGGHIVQGHVDGVGSVIKIQAKGKNKDIWFKAPRIISKYIVPKGSITIDGVSLTVVQVKGATFSVALIPFTLAHTTLKSLKPNDSVNMEADILAKYVAKYVKR